jgi:hypothetical protein
MLKVTIFAKDVERISNRKKSSFFGHFEGDLDKIVLNGHLHFTKVNNGFLGKFETQNKCWAILPGLYFVLESCSLAYSTSI